MLGFFNGNLLRDVWMVHNLLAPMLHDNYRVDFDTFESKGPIVLIYLPPCHTFFMISILIQILIAEGSFSGLCLEVLHS